MRELSHAPLTCARVKSMQFNWFCTFLLSFFTFFDYIYCRYNLCYSVLNNVNTWIRINSAWIRIKIAYWINSNKSYITLYRRVITLHSWMHLPTATIILPLNGVNSNLLSSRTPAFNRHFYCSIQKIKFLLDLV